MHNMNYCRFENTYYDLDDCYNNIDDDELSETEEYYREKIIKLCCDIAQDYGYKVDIYLVGEEG